MVLLNVHLEMGVGKWAAERVRSELYRRTCICEEEFGRPKGIYGSSIALLVCVGYVLLLYPMDVSPSLTAQMSCSGWVPYYDGDVLLINLATTMLEGYYYVLYCYIIVLLVHLVFMAQRKKGARVEGECE